MKNIVFTVAILFAATAAFGQKSDDRAAVLGVVDKLFAEMAAANPAGIIDLNTTDAQLAAIRKTKDGKMRLDVINREQFSKFFTDKTAVIEERMYDQKVVVDGDWAMVWGRYVFFVSKKISHCGINQFNLVRTADGWKIANGASTIDPGNCTDKEKKMKPQ
ncbi:MAG: hypothetical protein IPL32_09755 [Chloracidobacterium sp.]|nr:hypothetical protein [Chloracidobacterium sp.]